MVWEYATKKCNKGRTGEIIAGAEAEERARPERVNGMKRQSSGKWANRWRLPEELDVGAGGELVGLRRRKE